MEHTGIFVLSTIVLSGNVYGVEDWTEMTICGTIVIDFIRNIF